MIRSRLGLKVLGMCALVLGMMAVWAGAAQAEETGGKWTYETGGVLKTFEGALAEPGVNGKIEVGTKAVLHSKVAGALVLYECTEVKVINGKLKPEGIVLGKLLFHGCITLINGAPAKNCTPKAEGSEGLIVTNLIKAQMLLHKLASGVKDEILLAEPEDALGNLITTFAVIESTEACAIGIKVPVGGRFALWDPVDPLTHLVTHLITEFAPLTHLYLISDNAEHVANILGSAEAFLTGAHVNFKWAGLWN
jgi:hypothetical protein